MGNESCHSRYCVPPDKMCSSVEESIDVDEDNLQLNFDTIFIEEFEKRIKRFAFDPEAKGKITLDQLSIAFEGTRIFQDLGNPMNPVRQLITTDFIANMEKFNKESKNSNKKPSKLD